LCLCFIFSSFALYAGSDGTLHADAAYSYNGYKTWTMKDASILDTLPNGSATISGTSYATTGVQGMNVGTSYIYTAKIYTGKANVSAATIYRTAIDSKTTVPMSYYASTSATSTSPCTTVGHANDLLVVTANDTNYLLAANCEDGHAISRYKIDGTKLYFTGYFDLINTSGNSMTCSSLRQLKHTGGYFYLILKNAENFYYCKIPDTASGGSSSNPTKINAYKIAILDKRNGVFAKSSSSYGSYANMETWVAQGFGYNSAEKTIYTPYFQPPGSGDIMTTAILTYYVGDIFTDANMDFKTDKSTVVLPTKTSFYLKGTDFSSSCTGLEVESCGFRTGQGTTGDLKMYICANAAPSGYEAIYSLSYKSGSGDFTPVADASTPIYTVKYNANGGTDTGTNTTSGYYKMNATRHVYGISTNLRPNYFEKSGYTFEGWYLYRQSDKKWLYIDNGSTRWYTKGEQPEGAYLALYGDKRSVAYLTNVNDDVITCYAQWKPNSTGTKSFYIQYDANGGSGTMADQKIVYGTSTAISKNTFTRSGYQFSGWIAFRRSDLSWIYKTTSELKDNWIAAGNSTTGNFLKAYTDGCTVSGTSSTDRDIVTFYAAWTKVNSPVVPTAIAQGTDFKVGGNVVSDAGLYTVTASILDSTGKEFKTKTVNPYATSYDLAGISSSLGFSSLSYGQYTYKVTATTLNSGSSQTTVTVINSQFNVTNNLTPITGTLNIGIAAPVYAAVPVSAASVTTGSYYSCTGITWTPAVSTFAAGTVYKANVTLKADSDHSFDSNQINVSGATSVSDITYAYDTISFTATFPQTADLQLSDGANGYAISDSVLTGTKPGSSVDTVKALFRYDVVIKDKNGSVMTSGNVGTGCTVSCAGKTCTVLIKADVDGDGNITVNDYAAIKAQFKSSSFDLTGVFAKAADTDSNGKYTVTDYIMIRRCVNGTYDLFR
ncbi:MAG: InlB B-repeat-containing protein, partial [Clostridia bacterium]|nr:InlB B-repeat-containing protein [Clostridia bacterium]